jgi:serine/threonine protein kinase
LAAAVETNRHLMKAVERLALENDSLQAQLRGLKKRLKPQAPPLDGQDAPPAAAADEEEDAAPLGEDWARLRREGAARGWLIPPSQVELGALLGEGGFGATYRGTWRGADCAVKQVRPAAEGGAEAFAREVRSLSLVRHPNVVPLYGACVDPPSRCWLVCELLPGGTLAEWLHGARGARRAPARPLALRLRAALDVACGMEALEQHDPPILHRDLKPANVLMSRSGRALVADFGLARVLTPDALVSLTPETGSYRYMAPECVRHEAYATQADVWSWACLCVETLASAVPYADRHLTPVQAALAVAEGDLRPDIPPACPPALAEMLRAAFDSDPLNRPSFAVIAAVLRRVLAEQEGKEAAAGGGAAGVAAAWQRWMHPRGAAEGEAAG